MNKEHMQVDLFNLAVLKTNEISLLLIGFLLLVILSTITNIILTNYKKSIKSHLKSKEILKDVFKHFQMIIVVMLGSIIDKYVIQQGDNVLNMLLFYYIGYLSIRILDNSVLFGVPIPKKLYSNIKKILNKPTE